MILTANKFLLTLTKMFLAILTANIFLLILSAKMFLSFRLDSSRAHYCKFVVRLLQLEEQKSVGMILLMEISDCDMRSI